MNWLRGLRLALCFVAACVMTGSLIAGADDEKKSGGFGSAKDTAKSKKDIGKKTDDANPKADPEKPAADDPKGSKEGDDAKTEPSKGSFGSARKTTSTKTTSSKSKSKAKDEEEDKDQAKLDVNRQKLLKSIERQLGRKKDGYFVIGTIETKFSEPDLPQGVEVNPQNRLRALRAVGFVEETAVEFFVQEGKEATANFLADYISEYPPAEDKPKTRLGKDEVPPTPDPIRKFQMFQWFPATPEGSQAASNYQMQLKDKYEEQQRQQAAQKAAGQNQNQRRP